MGMGSRRLNTDVPHELACEADEERKVVHFGESIYIGLSAGHDRPVRGTIGVRKMWSANSREQETGGAFVMNPRIECVGLQSDHAPTCKP